MLEANLPSAWCVGILTGSGNSVGCSSVLAWIPETEAGFSTKFATIYSIKDFVTEPQSEAEIFADLLSKVHQPPADPLFDDYFLHHTNNLMHNRRNIQPLLMVPPKPPPDPLLPDIIWLIQEEESVAAILICKNSAPGEDTITWKPLWHLPIVVITLITAIFNSCLRCGYFHIAWKTAVVDMIPKSHKDHTNPFSYRQIALLNVTGEVLKIILTNRLTM